MATPLNIIGGWYSDVAKPWAQQDICNYIPFAAEMPGTLSAVKAVDAPGLKPFVEIASNGGIRGMRNVEGKLLVVAGTTLYQISNTGVAIPRGTIPGTGLVSIDYNQQGIANQVLIGNGSAGYVYDTSLLTLERITDPAFPGTKAVAYLDSYLLGVEPLGRFWFHSNLADAEDYNALDRYESETAPDRIVDLKTSNEEVVVFNQTTTDFFVNTGASTGTFQSKGVSMDVGCASAASVVKLDNTLFWLDNYGVFQRLNGYSPQPVSTRVLESAISRFDWTRCRAMTYQDKGRKIVYWTFPGLLTIGYDVTTGLWHRRQAYGKASDRLSCIVNWNRKWIGGDYQSGRLYELDWEYMLQVDQPHVRRVHTMPLQRNGNRLNLHRLKLQFDTGGPETIAIPFPAQPVPPTISGAAPDGILSIPYAGYTYTLTGDAPLTVTLRSGTLPPGLTISSAGVISAGTPTTLGAYAFTLRVTDTNGLWADLEDEIPVATLMMAMGQKAPPAPGGNASFIPSTNGTDWSAVPSAPGVAPDGNSQLIGGTDRFFCFAGAVPSYTVDVGANWVASSGSMGSATGGKGVYHKGLFIVPGTVDGYYQSVDEAVTFTLRAEPTYPRSQIFAANEDRVAVFSSYYNTIHYCDDADATTPTWLQTVAHGFSSWRAAFGGAGVIKFTGAIGGLPAVKCLNDDGTLTTETLPTFATATYGSALCFIETVGGDLVWVLGTDSGEIAYKVNEDPWVLSSDTMSVGCVDAMTNGAVIVMVADSSGSADGEIKYSVNGSTWTLAPLNTPMSLFSAAALTE
ncbi:Ig domain-containing protein [Pseudoxanthomonas sp. CF125]|uniref:Ig domain-containing protein n=1 Tax=Pseudoxanthomonas sp. CF125 TaxID=1855303 RepID=UPI00087DFBCE|nr:Ig domain-containing protein [Pseudoxanthomonas sp. CF125]SDQ42094.1 hypothetical protein SAMN05216569_1060 [Pseudoxanthomonas sp. CF125]